MQRQPKSLKREILQRLALPLLFFMGVETVLSYFVTLHYVNSAYDRWLQDSAKSLAQEVKWQAGKLQLDLPPAAIEMFRWDEQDKTYFKIVSNQQGFLAGDIAIPAAPKLDQNRQNLRYYDAWLRNETVRVIVMQIRPAGTDDVIAIYVAETLNKRLSMMRDILLADLLPQTILVLLVGLYLLAGVNKGLQPLQVLTNEINERSPQDLRPIPDTHVFPEVRILINTLNALLAQLAAAIATQQRFIANAAHQLRTPLAGLKLQAERALRAQDVQTMQPALEHIQHSADRMSHLTSQLLVLARAEPISGGYQLKPLDLEALARKQCMLWEPKAWQRKIELEFAGTNTNLSVRGDEVLLAELLSNLLDNAIAYGNDHGHIIVSLKAKPAPQVIITDDGPGIPEHEVTKVFERFYRLPGSSGNGCGLGLAIVKEIADLHGAMIKLKLANSHGGTQVAIIFPQLAK